MSHLRSAWKDSSQRLALILALALSVAVHAVLLSGDPTQPGTTPADQKRIRVALRELLFPSSRMPDTLEKTDPGATPRPPDGAVPARKPPAPTRQNSAAKISSRNVLPLDEEPVAAQAALEKPSPSPRPAPPTPEPSQTAPASPGAPSAASAASNDRPRETLESPPVGPTRSELTGAQPVPSYTPPAHLSNPPPDYPALARQRGWSGEVLVRVYVDAEGKVAEVRLERTSGHRLLDREALRKVRTWRFVPARRGKEEVPGEVIVPVRFALDRT